MTRKFRERVNVKFDEFSAMVSEQRNLDTISFENLIVVKVIHYLEQMHYKPLTTLVEYSKIVVSEEASITLRLPYNGCNLKRLPNDFYSLIDNNDSAKELWDALERHMRGFEYGKQDKKMAVLYEYKTFKATEGELLLDTYIQYLQVINDLKKCGYKKDNCELNFKFLNNRQPERKQYDTIMRQTKNSIDINIDSLYNILKQNQGDVNEAIIYSCKQETRVCKVKGKKKDKKDDEKKHDMSKVKCHNCKKKGHFAKDCKKAKVKDYNYYKTKMLLHKNDNDEKVLLAED
uniref:CCHC-type domain-containing protein n=1 Tax=Tanacetum cinerariifolium TaxID=118510 RepID=A0A699GSH8_TANCI|nr:hypothetical protein [Tanacetum cinerariifolium]